LPGKPSTTMSAVAAVAIVPFVITVGRDTQTSIYKSDCTTPVPTNVATVTEGAKKAHTALSQEFEATVNFDLNNLPGSGMYTDLPDSEGGKIDVCIRVDLMLNAADNGIDLDGNGALDEGNISVAFKEYNLSILFSWLEDFSTPTPVDAVLKVLTEEDTQNESAVVDMDLQACHCDETKECVTQDVSQNSYLDVCISFGSNAYDDAVFDELIEFTVTQGDISVAAVAATVPSSLTTKDITAEMIVVKTRLISSFFQSGTGQINVSGSVSVQFSAGTTTRRLLNIGHSARALETTEQSFELNLKLEESENESSGCRGGVGISIMSMLFASFVAITFVMMV